MKRIVLAVGGSGGHVLPALALAEKLKGRGVDLLLAGGGVGKNPFLKDWECQEVAAAGRPGPELLRGIWQARGVLRRFRPDLVVGFGSFYAAPVMAAAVLGRHRLVLHASDALPGRVIRWCAPWAELVSVYFAETKGLKGVPVQMPIRGLEMPSETVAEVRKQLGLDAKKQTVLVCGGSQGAQALNERVPHGLVRCGVQVIHLVGKADRVAAVEQIYREGGVKALVLPFEERMGRVYKAADLAICRAGANTCAELIACGLPAVLIPFPAAMDKHQDANAAVLADQVGGAIALDQQQLTADWIASNIPQLPLEQMRLRLENYRMGMQRPSLDQLIMEML